MARGPQWERDQNYINDKVIVHPITDSSTQVSLQDTFDDIEATIGTTIPALHTTTPLDLIGSLRADGDRDQSPTQRGLTGWEVVGDGVFNVVGYGAVGNGTTDDTSAIQSAIDAANTAGGGVVYFPNLTSFYKITSTLSLNGYTNICLLGVGTAITLIDTSTTINRHLLEIKGASTDIRVSGFILAHDTTDPPGAGSDIVNIADSSTRIILEDVQCTDSVDDGVLIAGTANDVQLVDVSITSAGDDGIAITATGSNYLIERSIITTCTGWGIQTGASADDVQIIAPHVTGCTAGGIDLAGDDNNLIAGYIGQAGNGVKALDVQNATGTTNITGLEVVHSGTSGPAVDLGGTIAMVTSLYIQASSFTAGNPALEITAGRATITGFDLRGHLRIVGGADHTLCGGTLTDVAGATSVIDITSDNCVLSSIFISSNNATTKGVTITGDHNSIVGVTALCAGAASTAFESGGDKNTFKGCHAIKTGTGFWTNGFLFSAASTNCVTIGCTAEASSPFTNNGATSNHINTEAAIAGTTAMNVSIGI